MKIVLLTEAGIHIGYGHLFRCLSLYQAFKVKGHKPFFIINCNEDLSAIIPDTNFLILNWLENKEELFNLVSISDYIIIDSFLIDGSILNELQNRYKNFAIIDDFPRRKYLHGLIIDWTINCEYRYSHSSVKYLAGISYAALRSDFWNLKNRIISNEVFTILITFGGFDIKNLTLKVLKIIVEKFKKIKSIVIVGNKNININEIHQMANDNISLVSDCSGIEMRDYMLSSDLAITTGGQTLYELARTGTPTIAIGTVENSMEDILGWQKVNFIDYVGNWDDPDLEINLINMINKNLSPEIRERKSKIGQGLIDGKGCFRIVNALLANYSQ